MKVVYLTRINFKNKTPVVRYNPLAIGLNVRQLAQNASIFKSKNTGRKTSTGD